MKPRPLLLALALGAFGLILPLSQCSKQDPDTTQVARVSYTPIAGSLESEFSGDKAHQHVANIVAFGPRPPASEGYEKTLAYLESTLSELGWATSRQSFRAATPNGPTQFTNLLARHSSAKGAPNSLPVVIGGHIDSKKLSFPFVGANDGGSSTGIMLELARVLSTDPAAASQVELAFFDGEEAFRPGITANDGLYGSKYFAHDLSTRPSWPSLGIVLDIVGDPNFGLLYSPEAPASFSTVIEAAAESVGFDKPLVRSPTQILDDHVPLQATGLPCLHLIGDFSSMSYWHQKGDTLDKLSPAMLAKVGQLTLQFLAKAEAPN